MNYELIVILGLGPAGLFVARQLYNLNKRVIGIGKTDDIGRYSRCLEKQYIANNAEELLAAVKKIMSWTANKPAGLICSDAFLTYIVEVHPEIFDMLSFTTPDERTLRLMYNKQALAEIIKSVNIKTTSIFTDLDRIVYPVVAKPIIKRGKSPIPKISFLENKEQLDCLLSVAEQSGLKRENIIIQQKITGDNSTEFGYGGYFEKGLLINDVAFIQARQYPQGVSCTAIEIDNPKQIEVFRELTAPIISKLNYSGFIQFDIKMDTITKNLYVLDINPRPWGSISLMKPKGHNKNGNIFLRSENQNRNAIWHFPLKELVSFKNKKNIPFNKCKYLAATKPVSIVDLWDRKDIMPFVMQPIVFIKKLFRL